MSQPKCTCAVCEHVESSDLDLTGLVDLTDLADRTDPINQANQANQANGADGNDGTDGTDNESQSDQEPNQVPDQDRQDDQDDQDDKQECPGCAVCLVVTNPPIKLPAKPSPGYLVYRFSGEGEEGSRDGDDEDQELGQEDDVEEDEYDDYDDHGDLSPEERLQLRKEELVDYAYRRHASSFERAEALKRALESQYDNPDFDWDSVLRGEERDELAKFGVVVETPGPILAAGSFGNEFGDPLSKEAKEIMTRAMIDSMRQIRNDFPHKRGRLDPNQIKVALVNYMGGLRVDAIPDIPDDGSK